MNQHALLTPPCPPAQVLTAAVELDGPLQLDHLGDIAFALSLCAMSMDGSSVGWPAPDSVAVVRVYLPRRIGPAPRSGWSRKPGGAWSRGSP